MLLDSKHLLNAYFHIREILYYFIWDFGLENNWE